MNSRNIDKNIDPRFRAIIDRIGTPSFSGPGVMIYEIESINAMSQLPPEIVDLTITSPPYNIGKEYESPLPLEEYINWTEVWSKEVYRLTTSKGAFWLNLGYVEVPEMARAIPIPYLVWNRIPFYLIQEIIWNYGAGVAARRMLSPRNEKFLWYVKSPNEYTFNLDEIRDSNVKYPNQKKNGKIRVNPLGKNPSDVWQIPKVTTGTGLTGQRASQERTKHPAQFPNAVIDRIVKACSMHGDLVFDPFIGSGTTAEVALSNGRLAIGFEIRADYVEIAANRLERLFRQKDSETQGALFVEE